jgi:tetratricopeptide (TPR) repeat protein
VLVQIPRWGGDIRRPLLVGAGLVAIGALCATAAMQPRGAAPAVTAPPAGAVLAQVAAADPALRAERTRAAAGDRAAAVRLAHRYVDLGRAQADPRYHGRAEAVLERWWAQPAPPDDVLYLRATIRQAVHDFARARADLDLLVERRPDDVNARLTRAAVATVMGDLATARGDCEATRSGELIAAACAAPLASAGGDLAAASARLARALDAAPADAGVAVWARTSLGELARQRGDTAAAEQAFRAALALDPTAAYTLVQLADLLLDEHRDADAADLLRGAGEADPVLLRLAIAERRLGDPAWTVHARVVRDRLLAGMARGDGTHQREYALYLLELGGDPAGALAAARRNWTLQKEPIDARLVLDLALAAGEPGAAREVVAWLDANRVTDAVLAKSRARLEGSR